MIKKYSLFPNEFENILWITGVYSFVLLISNLIEDENIKRLLKSMLLFSFPFVFIIVVLLTLYIFFKSKEKVKHLIIFSPLYAAWSIIFIIIYVLP